MTRNRGYDSSPLEANVWPAVTDTMILMASIFIILAVVAMVTMAKKLDEQLGAGAGPGEKIKCTRYPIEADDLFDSGKFALKNKQLAKTRLLTILNDIPTQLDGLRAFADSQKDWEKKYYVVIEVAGHADCDPLGKPESGNDLNWDLSTSRSNTVVHSIEELLAANGELKKRIGMSLSKTTADPRSTILRAAGYSNHLPSKLYSKTPSNEEKAGNRRVEIRVFVQPAYLVQLRDKES